MESSQNETIMLINDWNEICFNEWKFWNRIWNIVEGTIEGNEKVTIQTNLQKLHA